LWVLSTWVPALDLVLIAMAGAVALSCRACGC